jgi:hypothetical protein
MDWSLKHPVIANLPEILFPMKEIYRRIGMPQEAVEEHAGVAVTFDEALILAKPLVHPKGIYRISKIGRTGSVLRFENDFIIDSPKVIRLLKESEMAVFFMTTIGSGLEALSAWYAEKGDMTLAFMLDAIASETADAAADALHRHVIRQEAKERGYRITPRFSPGYGDWPVTVQPEMLKITGGGRIGISVTETCLMIPRKSVSAVFGLKKSD